MRYPPTPERARISEIFSSLQGEGPRMGERHLFVRFEECQLDCRYCDEAGKVGVEMTRDDVLGEIARLEETEGPHSFVCFTGGEPLLYLSFLKPLMRDLKDRGARLYLETNGILWRALREVIGYCDCVAMDMKPASVTGRENFDPEHERFLRIAVQGEVFVKMVISTTLDLGEFEDAIGIVERVAPEIPVILQPVTPEKGAPHDAEDWSFLESLQRMASRRLKNVRIYPRLHRILNLR